MDVERFFREIKKTLTDEYSAGTTQAVMAERRGVTQQTINRFLSGTRAIDKMSLQTFLKMFPHAEIRLEGPIGTFYANHNKGVIQSNVQVSGDNQVNSSLSSQERELLARFRALPLSDQAQLIFFLDRLNSPSKNSDSPSE